MLFYIFTKLFLITNTMEKPLILVTNDDGVNAPGIRCLIDIMSEIGEVIVVAPDSPQSGTGHAITINSTLHCSKITPKNAVLVAIIFYTLGTSFAYFMTTREHFFMLAGMIGLFQGGIQAISRSLFARLVPKGKEGEFFGFYNMLGKFSAVIGPILLGTVSLITGDVRIGLVSIVVLFIGGGLVLYKVDFDEGERIAKEYSS